MNWPLVLDFVKALAAPTATVLAVLIASTRAIKAFRTQKLIERRLGWYETMIEALTTDMWEYQSWGYKLKKLPEPYPEHPYPTRDKARNLARIALLYADESGVAAIAAWREKLAKSPAPKDATEEDSRKYTDACFEAIFALASEARRELGLPPLKSGRLY